jgi:hypothetical protein
MAGALREWTASDVPAIEMLRPKAAAAVRGARADAADVDHRCAHRGALSSTAAPEDMGFRCCYGEPNEAVITAPPWQPAFRDVSFPPSQLQAMVPSIKGLSALDGEIKYFREANAIETVKARAEAGRRIAGLEGPAGEPPEPVQPLPTNAKLTTAPLLWSPLPGEELLLVVGQSGSHSFILAFHQFSDGGTGFRYRVASSLIMVDDPGPIVLIYHPNVRRPEDRRRLFWTSCWDCYGETGHISYRPDHRVVITQK